MTSPPAASPATVEASITRVIGQAVALDDAGQHGAQLVARRVVGVVAELLDAVGERGVGEHQGDALHRPVDAALGGRGADRLGRRLAAGEPLDRLAVVVVERLGRRRSSSSSVVARSARSSSPSDCSRVFIWFTVGRTLPAAARASDAKSHAVLAVRAMATVVLDDVNKVYDNGFHAIHDLSLDIADSEFLVLVGPSGCGKSTALRMVAGLETITSGELRIGDRVVNDVEPKDRDIAMVFQNYALYPHMTVFDNIGFALKLARVPKPEIDSRVRKAAAILELEPYLDRKPGQLSGGQRQRVAMGRAIVRQPAAFLMDEPLSNLDAKLRVQMRAEIARLQRDLGVTTIYVTHDQVEAMTMGDRVAVLKDGYLQQVDTPQNLYD